MADPAEIPTVTGNYDIPAAFQIPPTPTGVLVPGFTGLEPVTPDFWVLQETYESTVGPLGQGSVGNGLAGELFHMLGQCASLRHDMEDQAQDQFPRTDHRRTATTHATTAQQGVKERTWDQLCEQSPEGSHRNDSMVSHPQLNGVLHKKVQG